MCSTLTTARPTPRPVSAPGSPALEITNPNALNLDLHREVRIKVLVTKVGNGRPRYLLIEGPQPA
ncbi:MAG: hypothetical protein HOO96_23000 [Polyangiaceae bacterium]|nr:hypothetical protein [Polyangiaceae bacterium]